MARLEDLREGARVEGIVPGTPVTIVDIKWHGSNCVEITYKNVDGRPENELLYRENEPLLKVISPGRAWSFDGDGALLRLVSEAHRIRLAYLFDPLLAINTSLVEPLPHQITAVYGEMLPRQPLRYLLADDPGAGKTIMAGLLIKELIARGDVQRCLICCPGSLVEQWQDEMWRRFQLDFKIISNQTIEDSKSGNPYRDYNLVISRLDHMSRNEKILERLQERDLEWDLVVVDEAHKMSAHFFGQEVKETKRFKLGKILASPERTRHFLLMTATPHNGKEEDFQLFMSLLDGDRFEGKFRDGVHETSASDLMRRMVKEKLVKFDGKPLFPERIPYTINYQLSDLESALYKQVTDYVRQEMNRADKLLAEGEGRRVNRIGFALTILQRRLASSPEAIYQSLKRRRERLESRLNEEKLLNRGSQKIGDLTAKLPVLDEEEMDDLDEAPDNEVEVIEDELVEQASAARTIAELEAEIDILKNLEKSAETVRRSGTDKKWEELSELLQNNNEMFDADGHRLKLIIFSEHKDTVNYLVEKIRALLGRSEAVITIHGAMKREDRRKLQEMFTQQKEIEVLVATDAAGEGINLQRAHLMINYDLPWNPNRLEQRFGRIHRIGQTEVCHMWSLVAGETREGDVYKQLLDKLEQERKALGGGVFDVLGKAFLGANLRKLLIEAVRYGDLPEVKQRLEQEVESALDRQKLTDLLEERALAHDVMDASRVRQIRQDMERFAARRLQPHFIRSFFIEAFKQLGGTIREREPKRYEIPHVPAVIRHRSKQIGGLDPVVEKYERVCFDKELINLSGKANAAFICPGHPLLDAVIDLILERYRELLKKGALLVDPNSQTSGVRALFYLEHSLQDARSDRDGTRRVISRRMQYVELDGEGKLQIAGYAPYLDFRPVADDERELLQEALEAKWLSEDLEPKILSFAIENMVPKHLDEVKKQVEERVNKTIVAVKDRLTREINYWDLRASELRAQEEAGKPNAKINSGKARKRADELHVRLQKRLADLEKEKKISPLPPVVIGGALVVSESMIKQLRGDESAKEADLFARETKRSEELAMAKVMEHERKQGHTPKNVANEKLGYDIESQVPETGKLIFIEVKGRNKNAATVTITKNEILTGLNKPDDFFLVIVPTDGNHADEPIYILSPFQNEPDFGVTSVNYSIRDLIGRRQ